MHIKKTTIVFISLLLLFFSAACKEDICISGIEVANKQHIKERSFFALPYDGVNVLSFKDSSGNVTNFELVSYELRTEKRVVGEVDCGEDRAPSQKFYLKEVAEYLYVSIDLDTLRMSLFPHIWNVLSTYDDVAPDESLVGSDFFQIYLSMFSCPEPVFVEYQVVRRHQEGILPLILPNTPFVRFGESYDNQIVYNALDRRLNFSLFFGLTGFKT